MDSLLKKVEDYDNRHTDVKKWIRNMRVRFDALSSNDKNIDSEQKKFLIDHIKDSKRFRSGITLYLDKRQPNTQEFQDVVKLEYAWDNRGSISWAEFEKAMGILDCKWHMVAIFKPINPNPAGGLKDLKNLEIGPLSKLVQYNPLYTDINKWIARVEDINQGKRKGTELWSWVVQYIPWSGLRTELQDAWKFITSQYGSNTPTEITWKKIIVKFDCKWYFITTFKQFD